MDELDPRHGTTAGWQRHRKEGEPPCHHCREAWRQYRRRWGKIRRSGRLHSVPIDHGNAWQKLDQLVQQGHTYRAIAKALNLRDSHIYKLHIRAIQTVRPTTWHKLMATPIWRDTQLTHEGMVRRIQALCHLGWTGAQIAAQAGLGRETVKRILRGERTTSELRTRELVAALFQELSMRPAPTNKFAQRARNRARANGWAPPLAWDDIDDPHEQPNGWTYKERKRSNGATLDEPIDPVVIRRILNGEWHLPATPAERAEVIRAWIEDGHSMNQLARQTGWKIDRYHKTGEAA